MNWAGLKEAMEVIDDRSDITAIIGLIEEFKEKSRENFKILRINFTRNPTATEVRDGMKVPTRKFHTKNSMDNSLKMSRQITKN